MSGPELSREVVVLELDAEASDMIFEGCRAHGFPQNGEGVVSLLMALLSGTLPGSDTESDPDAGTGARIGEAIGTFLSDEQNRRMLKELARMGLGRMMGRKP